MRIYFSQVYIEPGAEFPFTAEFQRFISGEISALSQSSAKFVSRYGEDFNLIFNISAKRKITENEVRGPTVFRKTRDVEYTIFLPFDVIDVSADSCRSAITFLLGGVIAVLSSLDIDPNAILVRKEDLLQRVCSDPVMIDG